MEGVDYASDHPSPAGLAAAGKRFVVRYAGAGGSWKHLSRAEANELRAAGLWLVANVEGAANGLLGGRDVGAEWARQADIAFRALGMPTDRPIYLSADFDVTAAQWPKVADALRGAASVLGPDRVGVYGSYDCVRWAARDGVARWFWQTYAWSSGQWWPGNHIEQYRNGVTLAGGTVDLCRSTTEDFGQWGQEETMATKATDITLSDGSTLDAAIKTLLQRTNADVNEERFRARTERAEILAAVKQVLAEVSADPGVPVTIDDAAADLIAGKVAEKVSVPTPADVADEVAHRLAE